MSKKEVLPPKFMIGAIVANEAYAGKIEKAFYANDDWNYNIGENASVEPTAYDHGEVVAVGYRVGLKYIAEKSIKWRQSIVGWEDV